MVGVSHASGETALTPSQRRIVAILTAAGPAGVSSARFADELYGDDLTDKWEASARQAISRMRKALGVGTIVTHNGRYALELPADEVDVWKLLRTDEHALATEPEDVLQQLLSGDPFADVEPSPLLRQAMEHIAIARRRLIERIADLRADHMSPSTLLATRTLALRSHYQQDVLLAVLRLHINAGDHSDAAKLATDATAFLRDELGVETTPTVAALIATIPAHNDRTIDGPAEVRPVAQGRVVGMPDTTIELGNVDRVQLTAQLEASLGERGALLNGDSGAGKSALVKSLVLNLTPQGNHVVWLNGRAGSPAAYEPFVSALPVLEEDLAPLLHDGGDPLLRSKCWSAVRHRLLAEFNDLPLIIVVDDAQLLDSHSQRLIVFLASTYGPAAPRLIVTGRDDASAPGWESFGAELVRLGLKRVEVGVFDLDELVQLIGVHHRLASSKQRLDFATTLYERRASLPVVAHELVQSADPVTLAIIDPELGAQRSEIWSQRVGQTTQRVAAVAAVVGMRFRVASVAHLSGIDVDIIVDAIDELLDERMIVAEQRPDEFSFRHVLIHADFDGVLNRGERRRLHLDAADMAQAAGRVHARATHMSEAGALIDGDQIVDAILASARAFFDQGSHREAVETFTRARQLTELELNNDDLLNLAEAIANSGGDAWELRSEVFETAIATGDTSVALDIALTGVLKTEDAMGEPRRLNMLERIDMTGLAASERSRCSAALARELGLLGFHERAIETARHGIKAATNPDDRLHQWFGAWAACRAVPPAEWPDPPADRHQVTDPELVSRLAQIESAQALILGDDSTARSSLTTFANHPFTQADPLRNWHAALAQTLLAFVDGRWEEHRQLADDTFAAASTQGVIAAFSARAAQEFARKWIIGEHGTLLPQLEAAAPDVQDSFLARAAFAVILAEHDDRQDEATTQIAQLGAHIVERPAPFAHPAAGVLASAPANCLSEQTRSHLRHVLTPFLGTALVVGASISHAGPVALSLSRITNDHADQVALLQQACDEADQWNLRLWSVVARLELADISASTELRNQAQSLAAGSSLTSLF